MLFPSPKNWIGITCGTAFGMDITEACLAALFGKAITKTVQLTPAINEDNARSVLFMRHPRFLAVTFLHSRLGKGISFISVSHPKVFFGIKARPPALF